MKEQKWIPIEIGSTQGKALAIRWLLAASRKRPGRNMAFKLSSELVDAAKGSGDAIRKKEESLDAAWYSFYPYVNIEVVFI